MHKSKRVLIPLIVISALAITGLGWYFTQGTNALAWGTIEAAGTVEAVEVSIASELSGRVLDVLVSKGASIDAGEILVRLDDELLQSQRQRALRAVEAAQANLVSAQSGVELAKSALSSAEAALRIAEANQKAELIAAQQALDDLYENQEVALSKAQDAVAAANRAVRETTYQLDNFTVPSNQADLTAAEGIELTKARLDEARQKFEPYRNLDSGNETRQDLKEILDNAQSDYDAAVKRLEYESAVALAAARLVKAQEDLVKLQSGPDPDQVAALEARIAAIQVAADQAIEAVEQARIGVIQAEARLQYAQETIGQAQAELETIDVQLKKLEISAPFSGIILFRSVEAGEVIQAGAPLMTLARLDELTITVYVPEDRYGQVKIGDAVQIEVDSFPGETFDGVVVYIADQAEFTPRNVQTAEGRRTTVFAIEIDVKNPLGKLKPGMPADVCFGCR